jgi:hypothetical protein
MRRLDNATAVRVDESLNIGLAHRADAALLAERRQTDRTPSARGEEKRGAMLSGHGGFCRECDVSRRRGD